MDFVPVVAEVVDPFGEHFDYETYQEVPVAIGFIIAIIIVIIVGSFSYFAKIDLRLGMGED